MFVFINGSLMCEFQIIVNYPGEYSMADREPAAELPFKICYRYILRKRFSKNLSLACPLQSASFSVVVLNVNHKIWEVLAKSRCSGYRSSDWFLRL